MVDDRIHVSKWYFNTNKCVLFNKYSYRKLFLIALLLFTIGSLVCGISTNFPIMMGGRVLQAIGAGILMPLGSNVIVTIFPPENVVWQWEQWVLQ